MTIKNESLPSNQTAKQHQRIELSLPLENLQNGSYQRSLSILMVVINPSLVWKYERAEMKSFDAGGLDNETQLGLVIKKTIEGTIAIESYHISLIFMEMFVLKALQDLY